MNKQRGWTRNQKIGAFVGVVFLLWIGAGTIQGDPLLTKSSFQWLLNQKVQKVEGDIKGLETTLAQVEQRLAANQGTNPFSDMKNHWAAPYATYLYQKNITTGFPDKTFRPEESLTREQVVVFIGRSKGWTPDPVAAKPFSDVTADRWSAGWIARAKKEGYANGYPDGTFKPESPVTRGELASLLCRAFGFGKAQTGGNAVDISGYWAEGNIRQVLLLGIDQVDGSQRFRPTVPATRGEVAALLSRSLEPSMRIK